MGYYGKCLEPRSKQLHYGCSKWFVLSTTVVPRNRFERLTHSLEVYCSILLANEIYNEIGQSYKFSTLVSTPHRFYLFSLYHLTFGRIRPKVCYFILNRIILAESFSFVALLPSTFGLEFFVPCFSIISSFTFMDLFRV